MRRVVWSETALDDLEAGISYIAERNPQAAHDIADRIDAAAQKLGEHVSGRPGRVEGTYEKSVRRTPYIIAYVASDDSIIILRVIHTSRNWPPGEWPTEDS